MTAPLSVEAAQAEAIACARLTGSEQIPLSATADSTRVLAEDVVAEHDLPPHDNSAMDGYAVRHADTKAPAELRVIGEIAAGHPATRALGAGEAFAIMTGAPLPEGADSIVMIEDTERIGERVKIARATTSGAHVRKRGEDVRAGMTLLRAGDALDAGAIAICAAQNRATLSVRRRPVVAILSTGDELRPLGEPLGPGQITESNSYALARLVARAGGIAKVLPLVRDDRDQIAAAISAAQPCDFILTSGGVSVGEHDHVRTVLDRLGAQFRFWRVNMKPGKPLAVAMLSETPFFGLPGNPVSSMVSFLLFVRPAIRAALGARPVFDLPRASAVLDTPCKTGDRRSYLRAKLSHDDAGQLHARPVSQQGSGMLSSMLGANGLVVLEPDTRVAIGASVSTLLLGDAI